MTMWLVRAGRSGEKEQCALENRSVLVGWEDLPDLSACTGRDELQALLRETYPAERAKTLASWQHQIWPIRDTMQVGDLVALPMKTRPTIAFGTIVGHYSYRCDLPWGPQHTRPVEWLAQIPRSALDPDMLFSLGAFMTVCRIVRNDAEQRIRTLLTEGHWAPPMRAAGPVPVATFPARDHARVQLQADEPATQPLRERRPAPLQPQDRRPASLQPQERRAAPMRLDDMTDLEQHSAPLRQAERQPVQNRLDLPPSNLRHVGASPIPLTHADFEQRSRSMIRERIAQKFKGHHLADLVAALLEVQGYRTRVSAPGPDGGVDILAGTGPLGFGSPTLVVQVKSQDTKIDVRVLRELGGVMGHYRADQGLLVGWGGFNQPVRSEAVSDYFRIRLWDSDDLVRGIEEHYHRLPARLRSEIPLKQIWTLAPDQHASAA